MLIVELLRLAVHLIQAEPGDVERGHGGSAGRPVFTPRSGFTRQTGPLRLGVGSGSEGCGSDCRVNTVFCWFCMWQKLNLCVCVCVRLQEVYSAPLRFLSDAVYDDPWSRHLMCILAPLQYMKVAVHLKHL